MKSNMVEKRIDRDPLWESSGKSARHLVVSQWLESRRRSWSSLDLLIDIQNSALPHKTSKLSPIKIFPRVRIFNSITQNDSSFHTSSIHPSQNNAAIQTRQGRPPDQNPEKGQRTHPPPLRQHPRMHPAIPLPLRLPRGQHAQ